MDQREMRKHMTQREQKRHNGDSFEEEPVTRKAKVKDEYDSPTMPSHHLGCVLTNHTLSLSALQSF